MPRGHPRFGTWAGFPWTKVACAYPPEFCEAFAELLLPLSPATGVRRASPVGPARIRPRAAGPPAELPAAWRTLGRWNLVLQGTWAKDEHQNVLECRVAVMTLRRLARNRRAWGRRVLIAVDSLVTLGVLARGRSASPALLALARQAGAILLACGIRPIWRWVASEHNYADGPSRGEPIGLAAETAEKSSHRQLPKRTLRVLQARGGRARAASGRHW